MAPSVFVVVEAALHTEVFLMAGAGVPAGAETALRSSMVTAEASMSAVAEAALHKEPSASSRVGMSDPADAALRLSLSAPVEGSVLVVTSKSSKSSSSRSHYKE